MRVRTLTVVGAMLAVSAACAPGGRDVGPRVGIAPIAAAPIAATHLQALAGGAFYCKVTGEVVGTADVASHLAHSQSSGATHDAASHDAHPGTVPGHNEHSPGGTGHGPQHVTLRGDHTHADHPCEPTVAERAAADKLAADTKAAVARYTDVSQAMLAGYKPNAGGARRVWHYLNESYQRDGDVLMPAHVESVVYGVTDRHGLVLIGALYIMPRAGMHGPQVGGCLTTWHIHDLGNTGGELPEMLHVWTVDMPGGPFAPEADPEYIRNL